MAVAHKGKFLAFVANLPYAEPDAMLSHFWDELVACARQVEARLEAPDTIQIDGKRHYLPNLDGKRDQRQYYIADLKQDDDGTVWPAVTFGSFKARIDNVFFKPRELCWQSFSMDTRGAVVDLDAKREYKRRNAEWVRKHNEMQAEVQRNEREGWECAAIAARVAFDAAIPVSAANPHPYLSKRGLVSMGEVRIATQKLTHKLYAKDHREWYDAATVCNEGDLLIPVYSADPLLKGIVNLQRITWNAKDAAYVKRFLLGGKIQHNYCPIKLSDQKPDALLVCEGYATGLALAMALHGQPYGVVVAFSLGNIASVAKLMVERHANMPILIAADNDAKTEGNPGLAMAKRLLADPPHTPYVMPTLEGDDTWSGDWDDLRQAVGLEAVSALLSAQMREALHQWHRYHTEGAQGDTGPAEPVEEDAKDTAPGMMRYGCLVNDKGTELIAQSFAACEAAKALHGLYGYEPDSQAWFHYADQHWQYDNNMQHTKRAVALQLMQGAGDLGFSLRYAEAVRRLQEDLLLLPMPTRPENCIPFANGLLSLDAMTLEPITPDRAMDWILPHEYHPHAQCPTVLAWLSRSLDHCDHSMELVRAFWAAALRGIYLQKFLVLIGPARTGKGTLQRFTEAMIGPSNVAVTDLEALETNRFETASLYRKRLCMISEAGKYSGSLNVLKKLTGGDAVRLEYKGKQQGRFTYDGLILLATNEDLRSTDLAGIERRRVTLRFSKQATQEELLHWQSKGGLESALRREMAGAINWALSMPVDEIEDIFERLPDRIRTENARAMGIGSSVADFALSHCQFSNAKDDKGRLSAYAYQGTKKERILDGVRTYEGSGEALYPSYLTYCDRGNRKPVSLHEFRRAMTDIARLDGVELEDAKHPENRRSILRGVNFTYPDHD